MEKRKLLLVAISVGIFLVIAIGAAIVFTPQKTVVPPGAVTVHPAPGARGINVPTPYQPPQFGVPEQEIPPGTPVEPLAEQPATVDPLGLVRAPADIPGLQAPPEGTIRQGGDFVVTGTGQTVINVPRPTTAAVPETAPPPRRVAPAPAPAAPAARPAAPAPARPAAQTRVHNDYWVQTGAFSTIAKAEGVRENLASRGITSIIDNRTVDGRSLFRVRVGPYTSQNEADYWLSLIRSINGFEESQVRQTQSRR